MKRLATILFLISQSISAGILADFYIDTQMTFEQHWKWVSSNITYKSDKDNYGVADYWATPQETLKRKAGDCEDFAILLQSKLKTAKIDSTIVITYDGKIYHAILKVGNKYIEPQVYGEYVTNPKIDEIIDSKKLSKRMSGWRIK